MLIISSALHGDSPLFITIVKTILIVAMFNSSNSIHMYNDSNNNSNIIMMIITIFFDPPKPQLPQQPTVCRTTPSHDNNINSIHIIDDN